MNETVSGRSVARVLVRVLVLNWLVALMKVALGLVTGSAGITADGFHSFADGASNIVGLIGIRYAYQPRDTDHPYGHKKIENFTAIVIAMMLFLVCFELIENGIFRLRHGVTPEIGYASFLVLVFTTGINYVVARYERRAGKGLKSDILIADSQHTRSDIFVSVAVMASMGGVLAGFTWLDPAVSLAIVVLIARMAIGILRTTSKVLCDSAVLPPDEIRSRVMAVKGVRGCHNIRTRGREDQIMMDLHVLVDQTMPVREAHDLSSAIEALLKKEFSGVQEVIVHIEPLQKP